MVASIPASQFFEDAPMLRTILQSISDGVYFTDRSRTIQFWNDGAVGITGYSAEEVVGRRCMDNILTHVDDAGNCLCTSNRCPLLKCFKGHTHRVERAYLHHKDGHRVPVRICSAPVRDADGTIIGGVETFHDISTEVFALRELDSLRATALLCPLTGVGNRRYCEEVLETSLQSVGVGKPAVGVIFLDVDHFKRYNDQYGHAVGDVVLKMVARTVSTNLRPFDFVGRWGGEEFLVVLPRMLAANLEHTAERLRMLVEASSTEVSHGSLKVTVSMGATMARPGEDIAALVERADKLMYESKRKGRNHVTVG